MNGTSTCNWPNCPNKKKLYINKKNNVLENILNVLPLIILLSVIGNTNKINIAANIAITPPNLSGIERKIA